MGFFLHIRIHAVLPVKAFTFIDRDDNGELDKEEVLDAFEGMGIYINQGVSYIYDHLPTVPVHMHVETMYMYGM